MRTVLVLLPLSVVAAPAFAQSVYPPAPPFVPPPAMQVAPEIAGGMSIDRMSNAAQAISQALLHLPVGEVRAAIQGREPTEADRRETIGREAHVSDRQVRDQIEAAKPMIEHGAKAMARALPRILQSVAEMQGTIDRAMANLPDPNYPRR